MNLIWINILCLSANILFLFFFAKEIWNITANFVPIDFDLLLEIITGLALSSIGSFVNFETGKTIIMIPVIQLILFITVLFTALGTAYYKRKRK